MDSVSVGIPGVDDVRPGTHLCAIYSGADERDALLFPFLREGLRQGEKCLCLVDGVEPGSIRDRAVARPLPEDGWRSEQLDADRVSEVCLASGGFSVAQMTSFLTAGVSAALAGDFPRLRAAGEMPGVLSRPADDFFGYESAVNEVMGRMPALFMCLYDLERFGVSMLADVLRTHPKVLLARTVLDNPHYLTPTEYPIVTTRSSRKKLAAAHERAAARDAWWSLTMAELRVAELVAHGMTNRAIADRLTVSPHTVDAHLKHTFTKLGIHSRVELTALAVRHHPFA